MRITCLNPLALALVLAAGCNNAPAPAAAAKPVEAKVVAAEPAKPAEVKVAAAEPAKSAEDEEEGCIYKDAAKEKHEEAGCPHGGGGEAAPGSTTPGHFGAVFALKDNKPLSQVLASAKAGLTDPVQVTGEVESVCQKKGCWLVVKDGEAQARVLMKDHAFTIPMDTKGKPVVVEGTIEARTFNEAQVKHLEKDAGKDPAAVSGERTEYVLTATAIELKNS
ncbi:DUF4920 domain-containing protein [Nannocystis sp.]|uniref:DUF4920 domain-containing protein n=1 Tax=Nannocystis sp. TaxID=1962667 RepID=UPI002424628B|nr:DUF4920 domain-containing protein [Nannocystis sp.]MBK7824806.1 DUF4920 domain-containing protein [Nannocystis sp.]MBK9752942.1 DUF4920 domain-containing protein [Nannocystis sp.]